MKKRVTLQDIARATGFTVNTVSRALKNKPDISQRTCETIQRVADDMGYVRNFFASSLRSGESRTIAVVVGGLSNPFYAVMAEALYDAAQDKGYTLQIMCSRDQIERELRVVADAIGRQVEGVVLFPSWESARTVAALRAAGMPFVLASREVPGLQADCAVCDEEMGGYLAGRHLIQGGCRKLAYVYSFDVMYSSALRIRGFERAAREAGLAPGDLQAFHHTSDAATRAQLLRWKAEGVRGLFVFCDVEAWELYALIRECGLSAPADFSLVGYDNIQSGIRFPAPLCTVDGAMRPIAAKAFELLMLRVNGDTAPPRRAVFPVELICRGSCRAALQAGEGNMYASGGR